MKNMLVCNYAVAALGAILGGAIMLAATEFPMQFTEHGPGPGFWPFALGGVLMFTALLLFAYNLTHREELSMQKVSLTTAANLRVYMLMGMVVAFCALIHLLGFYGAGLFLIPAVMLLMDYHNKKIIALTTVGTLGFIYLVFGMALRTQLPQSVFLR